MQKKTLSILSLFLSFGGCKPTGPSQTTSTAVQRGQTVIGIRAKNVGTLSLHQVSQRALRQGLRCQIKGERASDGLPVVPVSASRAESVNGIEYFVELKTALESEACEGTTVSTSFDFKSFFVNRNEVELILSSQAAPAAQKMVPASSDDLRSVRAEALARDMERRRSGGGKSCGLSSFGQRGCWSCVGWAMTDTRLFPAGLGSDADFSPNGFLRATAAARARKSQEGIVNINGIRFKSLLREYKGTPSLAPRGSILFCNTSAEGHAAVITQSGNEMRSDVIETIGATWRQSLCWTQVQEILYPLD